MTLNSFYLSFLSHNELHRLGSETIETVGPAFPSDAWFSRIAQRTRELLDDLRRVLDRKDKVGLTFEIRAADEARDNAFLALRAGVEFAVHHVNDAAREAGERLSDVIETYGTSLHRVGLGEQTTLTDALLAALSESENSAAVTVAGLDEFVDQLNFTQAAFKRLLHRRQDADASDDFPQLRTVRSGLHDVLTLVHHMLSFLAVTEPATVEATIRTLNERVEEITTPARARRTRSETDEEDSSVALAT